MKRLATFLEMIKFSHSVFALPFALVAMLVAAGGWPGWRTLLLIVVAVVAGRTAAMVFNRLADREFDARNPRTQRRALVTGDIRPAEAWAVLVLSCGVFVLAAGMLNTLCLVLSPVALAVLLGYSLMKRLTDYSHAVLGLALGLAPVGAWIAVRGELGLAPVLLGGAVLLWVAGFDILYSCQDVEVDRADPRLHSLPKRLGVGRALVFARRLHAGALLGFAAFAFAARPVLGTLFLAAVAGAGGLMAWQHQLVRPGDLSRVNQAFFTANGIVSLGMLAAAVLELSV